MFRDSRMLKPSTGRTNTVAGEASAQIKAYCARLDSEPDTGDRRSQELVFGQPEAGRDRVH